MTASCSLFQQLLNTVPRAQFEGLVARRRSDFGARGFTSYDQYVAMMFCHLGRAQLREIENGLRSAGGKLNHLGIGVPKRTTLAYANKHRPWELFRDLFDTVRDRCRSVQSGRHKLRFKNPLRSLDSTTIEVVSEMFDWTKYNKAKGAIKLHLLLDHDGYLPSFASITDGQSGDITVARTLKFDPGSVIVFDRGYIDYEWFRALQERGVWYVTRLKKNANYTVVETRRPPQGILSDELVDVTMSRRRRFVPLRLRRVTIMDPRDSRRRLVFFSNLLHFGARTIAAIYKERWQIEIFFKTIKQHLKIKTFIGTSMNAIQIQLWTALIAILLLRFLKLKSLCAVSLSNLVAMLRLHLLAYRELWTWLKAPFEPPPTPLPQQLTLLP
jgi:Transposase DDE domain/Domain of unknown function (DUF4372)